MEINQCREIVEPFFKYTERQIFEKFKLEFSNSLIFGEGDYTSLFIPGDRKDRVLLVAHVDTRWHDSPNVEIAYNNGIYYSKNRIRGLSKKNKAPVIGGWGIGADDRAGIALLWFLKELGHSILLTGCEEHGCLGSCMIMANYNYAKIIQDHCFAVELDRNGRNDIVFYNIATNEFKEYIKVSTGYREAEGSTTDICILCEDICGVNISVGYKNEHTCNEILNMRWWERTAAMLLTWLGQDNLPKFQRE